MDSELKSDVAQFEAMLRKYKRAQEKRIHQKANQDCEFTVSTNPLILLSVTVFTWPVGCVAKVDQARYAVPARAWRVPPSQEARTRPHEQWYDHV